MPPRAKSGAPSPQQLASATQRLAGRTRSRMLPRAATLMRVLKPVDGRGEEGATIVEMALTMVILLSVMFGLIELCFALYSYHFVSDAAREGSRYAIVHGSTCSVSGVSCTAPVGSTQIQTYVQNLGYPGINPSNLIVTASYSAYPAGGTCNATGCNGPGDLVTVVAKYTFKLSIPFVKVQTLNMTSTSSMVISQ